MKENKETRQQIQRGILDGILKVRKDINGKKRWHLIKVAYSIVPVLIY